MHRDLFDKLTDSFNAGRCLGHVEQIHACDRWFDFTHFHKSAQYCAAQLTQACLEDVELLPLKADGKTRYGDWVLPQAWYAESATLQFADTATCEPPLADYLADPCSLMMFSAPTVPDVIVAEVVIVDDPLLALSGTLKGKLILTEAQPGMLVPLAKTEGALGILSDFFPLYAEVRETAEVMNGYSRWENDLIYPVNDTGIFGFSLSPENGRRLRTAVADSVLKGPAVRLHATVNTCCRDGENETVSGLIPGSDPAGREILLCAHLYEPGANDNASGCGALLELAGAINGLIRRGVISRPNLGIRFIMGYECAGLMGYYAHHSDSIGRIAAAVNMDMVGAAGNDLAILHIWHNPLSNWSYMDTLLPALAREYRNYAGDAFEFEETPFSMGDNLLADPSIGVPTVSLIMHPAQSYHSSMDNMDRVDAAVLKRNSIIAGAAVLISALPDADGMEWLVCEMSRHRKTVLSGAAGLYGFMMDDAFRHAALKLYELDSFEHEICDDHAGPAFTKSCAEYLNASNAAEAGRIPIRTVLGSLTLTGLTGVSREELQWKPFYNYHFNCPLFWTDGMRTLGQIAVLSGTELGMTDADKYRQELEEYFNCLERLGYIRFA